MFLKRSSKPEMMDDFSIIDERIKAALTELHTINKYLGGVNVTEKGINNLLKDRTSEVKILDVGGGGSDVLSDLKEKYPLSIYSLDLNKYSCHYQKKNHPEHKIICADALKLPVKEGTFNIVHVSLFLHHFTEEEIVIILKHFRNAAVNGIIINDLRRNILAYTGIRILTMLFSRSTFVKNDGPLSVLRAFTRKDLISILSQAGVNNYIIKNMWAFRFLVIIPSVQPSADIRGGKEGEQADEEN